MYEYAREHIEVELPKREIEIKEITMLNYEENTITFSCTVSKGTYIRSLIKDICEKLGVLGTMSSLVRTKQGNFRIEDSYTLENLKKEIIHPLQLEDLFSYPIYSLTDTEYQRVKNGNSLELKEASPYVLLAYQGNVIALYEKKDTFYKPILIL